MRIRRRRQRPEEHPNLSPEQFVQALDVLREHVPDVTSSAEQRHRVLQTLGTLEKQITDYRPAPPKHKPRWNVETRQQQTSRA